MQYHFILKDLVCSVMQHVKMFANIYLSQIVEYSQMTPEM